MSLLSSQPRDSSAGANPASPAKPPLLKELTCPNCGGPINQYLASSQTFVCSKCGSHVAPGMEGLEILGKGRELPSPPVPIRLGGKLRIKEVDYFVLGRVFYTGWDPSDTSDTWSWTEWLCGSPDGRLLWLSYDTEDGFVLYTKLRLKTPFDPQNARVLQLGPDKSVGVKERYPAKVVGAEGELTSRVSPGDKLTMIEGNASGKHYSIQQTAQELEVYEGESISETEIARSLNDEAWLKRIRNKSERRGLYSMIGGMMILFAAIALIGGFYANSTGEQNASQVAKLSNSAPIAQIPVEFNQAGRPAVIRLWLRTSLPANSSLDLDVSVISPNESETLIFEGDFWYETGSDEDGPWSESSTYNTDTFVPFLSGAHTIEVELGPSAPISEVEVQIQVLRNHIAPAWLLVYGGIVGVLGLIIAMSGGGLPIKWLLIIGGIIAAVAAISASGVDIISLVLDILSEA